jgi:hypothetical protein
VVETDDPETGRRGILGEIVALTERDLGSALENVLRSLTASALSDAVLEILGIELPPGLYAATAGFYHDFVVLLVVALVLHRLRHRRHHRRGDTQPPEGCAHRDPERSCTWPWDAAPADRPARCSTLRTGSITCSGLTEARESPGGKLFGWRAQKAE